MSRDEASGKDPDAEQSEDVRAVLADIRTAFTAVPGDVVAQHHIQAMLAAQASAGQVQVPGVRRRHRLVGLGLVVGVIGLTGGLASADTLPASVQSVIASAARPLGIEIPDGSVGANTPPADGIQTTPSGSGRSSTTMSPWTSAERPTPVAPGATPGQSASTPGQSGSTPGQGAAEPPGQTGSTPGQSGSTPGQSGSTPGQGGAEPPGQPVTPPGQPVTPPGQPVTPPGQPVTPPGQPVTPPGQPVTPPGQPVTPPGQPVTPPGQEGDVDPGRDQAGGQRESNRA